MIRFLPYLVELVLLVFCLIDCIQTPSHEVRNLEKPFWVLIIIIVPLVGGIAWLVAGRPVRTSTGTQWRTGSGFPEASRPPAYRRNEDDPAFMAEMARIDREHEQALKAWEAKLKAQEEQLRRERGEQA